MKRNITSIIMIMMVCAIMFATGCSKKEEVVETKSKIDNTNTYKRTEIIKSAEQAKKLLIEGNKRFTSNKPAVDDISTDRKNELANNGQHPFAVIVGCSDSRVPAEIIFDQALGDIFVIRDAGNVVDPVALGSVEYGVEHLGAPLIVVLGHEKCGAVKATVDGGEAPGSIGAIVNKIKPSLDKVKGTATNKEDLYTKCEDENINNTIAEIRNSSIIKHLEEENKVTVVGAKYDIDTGEVVFTPSSNTM